MTLKRIIAATLTVAWLAGCMTVGPDYRRPKVDTPEQWPGAVSAEPISAAWWKASCSKRYIATSQGNCLSD